jgi:spoIIIJ-associated protein
MVEVEQAIEASGADVDAAIAAGLARLGVERDAVEIEVLDEGSRGLFGLGGREARVRLAVRPQPAPATLAEPVILPTVEVATPAVMEKREAEIAQEALMELLALMGMKEVRVDVHWAEPAADEGEPPLVLDVHGPDTDLLIGRRGSTLAALQYITRLIIGREVAGRVNLVVDVDGFKARREQALQRLAQRLAEQALRTGRTVVLEPMPPHERRYIHLALRDHPQVTTQSIGEGDLRKVTIIPQRGPLATR